jgi:hypothetical protein
MSTPTPGRLRGCALFIILLAVAYSGGMYYWKGDHLQLGLSDKSSVVSGIVMNVFSLKKGRYYRAIIEFSDADQIKYQFQTEAGKSLPKLQEGDIVKVLYEKKGSRMIAVTEDSMITVYFIFSLAAFLLVTFFMSAIQCWRQAAKLERDKWSKRVS